MLPHPGLSRLICCILGFISFNIFFQFQDFAVVRVLQKLTQEISNVQTLNIPINNIAASLDRQTAHCNTIYVFTGKKATTTNTTTITTIITILKSILVYLAVR